jgi:Chitobiase/beta-hexosaminidase C-terminal domain/Legume lectin domain
MYQGRTLKVLNSLVELIAMAMLTVCIAAPASGASSSGPSLIFNFPNGFAGALQGSSSASLNPNYVTVSNLAYSSGSVLGLNSTTTAHTTTGASYQTQQNIAAGFQTTFTFQLQNSGVTVPTIAGLTFNVQNAKNATNQPNGNWFSGYGTTGAGIASDANVAGYGCYDPNEYPAADQSWLSQQYISNSIAVKFDLSNANGIFNYRTGGQPSTTGLYANGGNFQSLNPAQDLAPYGINLYSTDIFKVNIVYDGALLTMTILDTNTGAQARQVWPVNIPALTGSNTNWVGFSGGNAAGEGSSGLAGFHVLNWEFWTGYSTRLATPTFSIAPGPYASTQSVSLSGPAGASLYYTTNGLLPTSSSTLWTGTPITVSSNQVIQVVAIQSGFTDSLVAQGNYQIQSSGAPLINFPSGFSNAGGLMQVAGHAILSGSQIQLTDSNKSPGSEAGAAWYAVPVPVSSDWVANFKIQTTSAYGNGMAFVMQNYPPTSQDTPRVNGGWGQSNTATGLTLVGGGPNFVGGAGDALGYASNWGTGYGGDAQGGLAPGYQSLWNSLAVVFDIYNGNLTGLYTKGAFPTGSGVAITGVTLSSGNPIACTLTYSASAQTLTLSMTDTVTTKTFSHTWTAVNLPTIVGGNSAYLGFSGATGGMTANQNVLSLTYSTNPGKTPMAPANLKVQ